MEDERYRGSTAWRVGFARFGTPTRLIQNVVTVGDTVTTILNENPRRLSYLIMNRGTEDVDIGFTREIAFNYGLRLMYEGGTFAMNVEEDGEATGYAVYGICGAALSSTMIVLEVQSV